VRDGQPQITTAMDLLLVWEANAYDGLELEVEQSVLPEICTAVLHDGGS
jgi:hypothetical protein